VNHTAGGITLRVAAGEVEGAGSDRVGGVETFVGTTFADTMIGSAADDDLRGGSGYDDITGRGGSDALFASGGVVVGGPGADFVSASGSTEVRGGDGTDGIILGPGPVDADGGADTDEFVLGSARSQATISDRSASNELDLSKSRRALRVDMGAGRAQWRGGSVTFSGGFTRVIGGRKGDTLVGSPGSDYIEGSRGDDVLRGRAGNDFLIGNRGFDRGSGEDGWDICLSEARSACER